MVEAEPETLDVPGSHFHTSARSFLWPSGQWRQEEEKEKKTCPQT